MKIIVTGSRSDPNRASQPARQFILNNNVGMLLTADTPETVNPVAVMARSEAVPCAATNDPWESWQVGLGGNPADPAKAFQCNVLFFFGLKELSGCFIPDVEPGPGPGQEGRPPVPNDADGNAIRRSCRLS